MYQLAIAANPDHFLDYDAPLSKQHPHVANALSKSFPWAEDYLKTSLPGGKLAPMDADNAQRMHQAGIPGVKYADSSGNKNYVVFSPEVIKILRKYARGGLAYHR